MPERLDWQQLADPRVARRVADALDAGHVVVLPTEAGYLRAAGALTAAAAGLGELVLAVRGLADIRDWVANIPEVGQRLARRLWPGLLTLVVPDDGTDLAQRLPPAVRERLCTDGAIRLWAPDSDPVQEVLRHSQSPVVLGPPLGPTVGDAEHAGGDAVGLVLEGPRIEPLPPTVVRVDGTGWRVLRAGALSEELIQQQTACLVVFVCTGNTCRSPMAEALFKKRLADRIGCTVEELPTRGYVVASAGLAAIPGEEAAEPALLAVQAFAADLSAHRSQPLRPELAASADYLVAMTRGHVLALTGYSSRLGVQPRLLDPAGEDLADPIGGDGPVYEECARAIWNHLEPLLADVRP